MGKTAAAELEARRKIRELRTEQAAARAAEQRRLQAAQAEQDRRIEAAIARLVTSRRHLATADEELASAQARQAEAAEAAEAEVGGVVRELKSEGLSPAEIVTVTGLAMADVRRASKAQPNSRDSSASGSGDQGRPAVAATTG
jgi:hypothetical protein